MIKRKGNLFDTSSAHIGHGVNTKGVMGAGIAKEFKRKFPDNYRIYNNYCVTNCLRPGGSLLVIDMDIETRTTYHIHNIASQELPGSNARYEWLFSGLMEAAETVLSSGGNVLAIPLIGCGIGGLEWEKVEWLLRTVEVLNPRFEFEVWKYE